MGSRASGERKKKRFIKEFQKDLDASKAATRAGYKKETARFAASRLMSDPEIKAAVQSDLEAKLIECDITAIRTLKEIAALAFVDIGKCFDEEGRLLPVHLIPVETRRAIQGVDTYKDFTEGVEIGETVKTRMFDKIAALTLLSKYFKLLTEKVEVSGKLSLEALVAGSNEGEE